MAKPFAAGEIAAQGGFIVITYSKPHPAAITITSETNVADHRHVGRRQSPSGFDSDRCRRSRTRGALRTLLGVPITQEPKRHAMCAARPSCQVGLAAALWASAVSALAGPGRQKQQLRSRRSSRLKPLPSKEIYFGKFFIDQIFSAPRRTNAGCVCKNRPGPASTALR